MRCDGHVRHGAHRMLVPRLQTGGPLNMIKRMRMAVPHLPSRPKTSKETENQRERVLLGNLTDDA